MSSISCKVIVELTKSKRHHTKDGEDCTWISKLKHVKALDPRKTMECMNLESTSITKTILDHNYVDGF
jgi:hypothetical protein